MTRDDAAFRDWRDQADAANLLATANSFGAKLKRVGQEHVGPCPACGGTDRLGINPSKRKWVCRGADGGNGAIGLAMHLGKMSFTAACEYLTGEPNPSGRESRQISPAELAEIDRRRAEADAARIAREAQQTAYEENTREGAAAIWNASVPLAGTLGEVNLRGRGVDLAEWPAELRFHPNCPIGDRRSEPAIVARVDDLGGSLCAVWRIILRPDGSNARDRDGRKMKLGLGQARGGAVRLGGMAGKIGVCEGVETALGAALLTGSRYPIWASLSTAGMVGLEVPLGVDHVVIYPDGDKPIRKKAGVYVPDIPAGRKAALALRERMLSEGVGVTIAAEPPAGCDYLDLWNVSREEVA